MSGPRLRWERLQPVLRVSLALICFGTLCYQSEQLLERFMEEPVVTSFAKSPARDMAIPCITCCAAGRPAMPLNVSSPTNWLWEVTSNLTSMLIGGEASWLPDRNHTGSQTTPAEAGKWYSWPVDKFYTICHTFTPNLSLADGGRHGAGRDVYYVGSFSFMQTPLGPPPGFKSKVMSIHMFLHPPRTPRVTNLGLPSFVRDALVLVPPYEDITVRIESEVVIRESLRRAPCRSTPGYDRLHCLTMCLFRTRAERFHCRTPQMNQLYPELPECRSNAAYRLHLRPREEARCGCPRACYQHAYTALVEQRKTTTREWWASVDYPVSGTKLVVNRYPQLVTTETATYKLVSLVSEIGGYVGLLVGVSLLSLLQMAVDLLERLVVSHRDGQPRTIIY